MVGGKKLEKRLENLEWEKERRDREMRRNNRVIKGMDKRGDNRIDQEVKKFIKVNLKMKIEVRRAFKIQTGRNKSIVVAELKNWEQKKELMIRKKELKAGIFIGNDLTKMEREIQEQLRDRAKKEKDKGNKVKLNYRKILVNDK